MEVVNRVICDYFFFFVFIFFFFIFFFFKQKTAYEIYQCDWSSDVCSSDLLDVAESIGQPPDPADLAAFIKAQRRFIGHLAIPGLDADMDVTAGKLQKVGNT